MSRLEVQVKRTERQATGQIRESRRRIFRGARLALAAAGLLVLASVTVAVSSQGRGRSTPPVSGAKLVAFSATSCSSSSFCVSGPNPGPTIYPGGAAQTFPVSFTNPYNVPITISSLLITFTNSFPTDCPSSDFEVSGPPGSSVAGSMPQFTVPINVTVAKATSIPTTLVYNGVSLALADDGNQDTCHGLGLTMNLLATGIYDYTDCISGVHSGGTVSPGQVLCVSKGGRLTGGVTVDSGGVLYVNGGSIAGGISATGPAGINLCSAKVSGGTTITGATGEVVIGDGQSCGGGTLGGLSVTGGTAGVQVIANSVSGGLTVAGNTGSIPGPAGTSGQFIESNSITGGFTCTPANTPALSDGGHPNTVSGPRTGSQCSGSF